MKFTKKYLQNLDNTTWIKIRNAEAQELSKTLGKVFKEVVKVHPEFTHTLAEIFAHITMNDLDIFYSLTERE